MHVIIYVYIDAFYPYKNCEPWLLKNKNKKKVPLNMSSLAKMKKVQKKRVR